MTTDLHQAARLLDLVSHLPAPPAASPPFAQALLGARPSLFLSLGPADARAGIGAFNYRSARDSILKLLK